MSITADMKNISMPFLAAVIIQIIESLHSQIIKANKKLFWSQVNFEKNSNNHFSCKAAL